MWISLFTIVLAIALGLGLGAVMLESMRRSPIVDAGRSAVSGLCVCVISLLRFR